MTRQQTPQVRTTLRKKKACDKLLGEQTESIETDQGLLDAEVKKEAETTGSINVLDAEISGADAAAIGHETTLSIIEADCEEAIGDLEVELSDLQGVVRDLGEAEKLIESVDTGRLLESAASFLEISDSGRSSVKKNIFDNVVATLQEMLKRVGESIDAMEKKKETCIQTNVTLTISLAAKENAKSATDSKINVAEAAITDLGDQIDVLQGAMDDADKEKKKLLKSLADDQAALKTTISENAQAIQILNAVMKSLEDVKPKVFSLFALLEKIKADIEKETAAEKKAVETLSKATGEHVGTLSTTFTESLAAKGAMEETKGQKEGELAGEKATLKLDIKAVNLAKTALQKNTGDCDDWLKEYEGKHEAKTDESDGLKAAIAVLTEA